MTMISEPIPNGQVGRNRKTRADLQREYVAGTGAGYASFLHTLPRYIEDIDRDFGDDIVGRMRLDPQYASCIVLLKLAILARGLDILPAVTKPVPPSPPAKDEKGQSDPGAQADFERAQTAYAAAAAEHDRAAEMAEFCKRQINGLTTPFVAHTLFNLLDCIDHGNKVAEVIYTYPETGPDKGRLGLKAVKVKPRRSIAFVVNAFMDVVGLLAAVPGQAVATTYMPGLGNNLLPRRKFLILTNRPKDEDPRGTNSGRPAYHGWWFKQQAWGDWLRTLATFAGGNVIIKTPPGAEPSPVLDDEGNETGTYATPEQVAVTAGEAMRNGSVIGLPGECEVQIERPEGDVGEAFQAAIDVADRQITQGILLQTRATKEAKNGSKADSETGQDILGILVAHEKTGVEQALRTDLLMPLIEYNWGPEFLYLTPRPTLGETSEEDLAALMTAVAALNRTGYFDPEQYPELDARMNMPVRSPESVAARKELRNAPLLAEPDADDEEREDNEK